MEKSRKTNLDIIRIIAIILVVSVHIAWYGGYNFNQGAYGVQLFFILSGYLAVLSFEKEGNILNYYRNRIKRIVPAYYFVLILVYFSLLTRYIIENGMNISIFNEVVGVKYLRYFLFLQCFIPSDNWDMWNNCNALWTMSSFAFFYLVFPLLYKIINRFWKSFSLLILLMTINPLFIDLIKNILGSYPESGNIDLFAAKNPLTNLYCFIFGITLYLALKEQKQFKYILLLSLFLIVTDFSYYKREILFTFLVFVAIQSNSLTNNVKCKDMLQKISDSTYYLYLLHTLVLNNLNLYNYFNNKNKMVYILYLYFICFFSLFYFCYVKRKIKTYLISKQKVNRVRKE